MMIQRFKGSTTVECREPASALASWCIKHDGSVIDSGDSRTTEASLKWRRGLLELSLQLYPLPLALDERYHE